MVYTVHRVSEISSVSEGSNDLDLVTISANSTGHRTVFPDDRVCVRACNFWLVLLYRVISIVSFRSLLEPKEETHPVLL
jgi:hypothetical protein